MPSPDAQPALVGSAKIITCDQLLAVRRQARKARQTFVFTNGCFDLLHRGHVEYLRAARTLGDCLAVGLNDDDGVRALKGRGRPLCPQDDRAAVLAALECVSHVCIFSGESVESLVAALAPDVLVKGGDYAPDAIVGREHVEARGGQVRALSLWPDVSTTQLIERIKALPTP